MSSKFSGVARFAWLSSLAIALVLPSLPAGAQQSRDTAPRQKAGAAAAKQNAVSRPIYFGQPVPRGTYTFMAALIWSDADPTPAGMLAKQFCGGSMIRDRWVLTAAHCLREEKDGEERQIEASDIDVYVGSIDFKGGQRIKLRRVVRHPDYNSISADNDVALLELAERPKPGLTSVITLISPATETLYGVPGKQVTAAGWGVTETGDTPKSMLQVGLDIVDVKTCNSNVVSYRRRQFVELQLDDLRDKLALDDDSARRIKEVMEGPMGSAVTENMICTTKPGTQRDTCVGDSGGPLFAEVSRGQYIQVGITSWSEGGCGMTEFGLFGVYTRVARFADWIDKNAR